MTTSQRKLLPVLAGIGIAIVIAWVQWMIPLGNYSIFAELGLAVGFYFCYAWYERIVASEEKTGPGAGAR